MAAALGEVQVALEDQMKELATINATRFESTPAVRVAIATLVRRLVNGFQPEKIILFGSVAYGHPDVESDLDVLIVVPQSSDPPHRRGQKAYKCVGAIGMSKDLLVLTREEFDAQAAVVTSLARQAQEEGIILYEQGAADRSLAMAGQEPA